MARQHKLAKRPSSVLLHTRYCQVTKRQACLRIISCEACLLIAAAEADPANGDALFSLGVLYGKAGQKDAAESAYQ
eukprot:9230875-Pyramimonas_sp.AAC.1